MRRWTVRTVRQIALATAVAAAPAGCGGGSDATTPPDPPPPIKVDGTWTGRLTSSRGADATIAVSLSEAAGVVQGSGVLGGGETLVALDVEGTYREPEVSLTFSARGYEPIRFVGTVSDSLMVGHANGSGFVNSALSFHR